MNRHRFSDVVTCDILFLKVSRRPVFSLPAGAPRSLPVFYSTFINNRNNVTTSRANVYRPFVGDVKVTLSRFVHFRVSRGYFHPCLSVFVRVLSSHSGFQLRRIFHAMS